MDGHNESSKHHSSHRNHDRTLNDTMAAERAWELWSSKDPADWDRALDARARISTHNPKAWSTGMHNAEEEEAKKAKAAPPAVQEKPAAVVKEQDKPVAHDDQQTAATDKLRDEYLDQKPVHPGYAPHSRFAPETPDSPAYDAAYNQPEEEFNGLDLGFIRAGVKGHSLDFGVNVGLAKTEFQLGQETRLDAEFMPYGGPLHARAGAGIGFKDNSLHSEVGVGANAFGINGDADFGVKAGEHTGVSGDVRGNVLPFHVQADAGADISPNGADAYTGANTGIADVFDVHAGGHVNADDNSGAGAGVGVKLGDKSLDFGPSISSDGNRTVHPQLHLDPGNDEDPTFYPTGDRIKDSGQTAKN